MSTDEHFSTDYVFFKVVDFIFFLLYFFFQAEDGIRDRTVTGVQTCALPISCQAFLPLLRKSKAARIVNVSSESGSLAHMGAGPPAYQMTKGALNALTRTLAEIGRASCRERV